MEVVAIVAARGLRNGLLKTAGIYNLTGRPSSIPPIIFFRNFFGAGTTFYRSYLHVIYDKDEELTMPEWRIYDLMDLVIRMHCLL